MIDIHGSGKRRRVKRFDMTPMIDVVFQLIIFFMFTSQLGQVTRTEIELPRERGDAEAAIERATLVIDIDRDGSLSLEGRPATFESLARVVGREQERLGDNASKIRVLIRAHRLAESSALNELAERLTTMGISRWSLGAVEPTAGGGGG
ncbi:MAG: hypothetical protein CMJ31_14130 [Phycisphaerae bacterium]|nr:hypothetical protein [Phycisphaerae bacterium]